MLPNHAPMCRDVQEGKDGEASTVLKVIQIFIVYLKPILSGLGEKYGA